MMIHLRDKLSRDVNRACTKWFRENGLAEGNFRQVMEDQAAGNYKAKQQKRKARAVDEIERVALTIELESRGEEEAV